MELEIRKLTPALAEEYAHFFDVTPHDVNIEEQKCYCVTWRSDASYEADGNHWFPTREERREKAIRFVREGSLQGYLAFRDGEIVGWCNANGDCRRCVDYLRMFWPIPAEDAAVRVKSVFCFVIAPQMQRRGIATKLLEAVVRDAAAEGYDYVEAYANEVFSYEDHDFRGPVAMYEKCGFCCYAAQDGRVVMRKKL